MFSLEKHDLLSGALSKRLVLKSALPAAIETNQQVVSASENRIGSGSGIKCGAAAAVRSARHLT
ncbi:MAG: hypothetical protein ACRD3W_14390, partial [Terriglobales bacterium]